MSKLYHIRSPNIRKIYFCGTFSCFMGITCLHTQTKPILAVSLTGQPSFYCPRFTRYGFCDFFALPRYFRCSRKSYSLAANSGGDSTQFSSEVCQNFLKAKFHISLSDTRVYPESLT